MKTKDTRRVNLSLDALLYQQVQECADREDMSAARLMRVAIRKYIEELKHEEG